jgi:hypothetical protein
MPDFTLRKYNYKKMYTILKYYMYICKHYTE